MLPYIPPSTIKDLSVEILGEPTTSRTSTHNDPDQFHQAESLEPDPVYMGLRALFTSGPIGRLKSWIEQKIEEREDRRHGYGPSAGESQFYTHIVDRPGGVMVEEPRERDIAA